MTGFDETVPPEPDPSADGGSADQHVPDGVADADPDGSAGDDNVVAPQGGPEATDADDERAPQPMGGDDDLAAGHLGERQG